jgi:hypothetical protein
MIKVIQPAQEAKPAVIEISGPTFFIKFGDAYLITKDRIIILSFNKLEIIEKGSSYDLHLSYCLKNGKEVLPEEWFQICKSYGSNYTKQLNELVGIENAYDIFCQ